MEGVSKNWNKRAD